jgi:pimeloyl-ACP methyl ester carboxylesterase
MGNSIFKFALRTAITLAIAFGLLPIAKAQPPQEPAESNAVGYVNWPLKTLGGKQFWSDVQLLDGYRLQMNAVTGHFRLIDGKDVRLAWGNQLHCEESLKKIASEKKLKPYSGRVILLLHGLVRSHDSMQALADHLRANTTATVIQIQYASGQAPIAEHAAALADIIRHFGPQVTSIDFVGHSMGNIVVRHYLADLKKNGEPHPQFHRMVMLAPPNQGSKMATLLNNSMVFNAATGISGFQLGRGWKALEKNLATPDFEFAIIAGGTDKSRVVDNPLLAGPNDLTVDLSETKLPGAADTSLVPGFHAGLLFDPEVHRQVASFLENGFLVAADKKQPLPREENLR